MPAASIALFIEPGSRRRRRTSDGGKATEIATGDGNQKPVEGRLFSARGTARARWC